MSDKTKELLISCLSTLTIILGVFFDSYYPIIFALQCVFLAGILILGIPMVVKEIKEKKAAKQAKENDNNK